MSEPVVDANANSDNELRIRGKKNPSVVQSTIPGPFATPVRPETPMGNVQQPEITQLLPEPKYQSQASMNRVFRQALETPIQESDFDQRRSHFIKSLDNRTWNFPGESLPNMEDKLQECRALVIAINYGGHEPLPATYVDAHNMLDVLQKEFKYHPKCIRVLADQVDMNNRKDERWPNKDNIIEGLKWLVQGTREGSRRFLFFAGHGVTWSTTDDKYTYTNEGILPKDFLTFTDRRTQEDRPDPKTVLFDDELNKHLVEIANGTKLTVMFDCCYSGGLTALVPETADLSGIRKRTVFSAGNVCDPPTLDQLRSRALANQSGNFLGLPLKIHLATGSIEDTVSRAEAGEMEYDPKGPNAAVTQNFTPFPKDCQVISWAACSGTQLAREDKSLGGRFTSAFMNGVSLPQTGSEKRITYRVLNRHIHEKFEEHNQYAVNQNENATGDQKDSAIRASKTQNAEQREVDNFQSPKLYVSKNIESTIADSEVHM